MKPQQVTHDSPIPDALRGLAAMYVMLNHARWLLWSGYSDSVASGVHGIGLAIVVLSSGFRYAHEAVLLFFLLSGFCIHYRQAKLLATTSDDRGKSRAGFDVRSYAWRRLRRLYPPLLVGLALTALFDFVGEQVNPTFYAGRSPYPLINDNMGHASYSITTLLGNLLFQADFVVPAFGTNDPLWSLTFEFWFYVMYPVAFVASTRRGPGSMLSLAAVVSAVGLVALHGPVPWISGRILAIPAYWILWVAGAWLAEAYVGRVCPPRLGVPALIAMAGLVPLALEYPSGVSGPVHDLLWGLVLTVLLAYVMLSAPRMLGGIVERAAQRIAPLGDISYTLYVIHFPWLALVSAWWLSWHPRLPLGAELAIPGAVSAVVLAVCCWYMVERHFVSRRVARALPVQPASASAVTC